ncbi:hypothetical protein Tco_1081859 [Tanacetum coccineum]|uniref:Reverse transcriptase domain-containing protein n=1 Tax=Tanacetum coccineum TaxID=301880 RepID=A0ABQ5I012_9ASTR
MEKMTSICDMIPICYDDEDDEESSIPLRDIIISGLPPCVAIIPVLSTEEPIDSLIMEDEHLDTIPATESDEYVEASPLDSELVSLEVVEIVIPEVRGIDTDILLTIKDDILCEKLLNVNLLIAKIEALKDNPIPSFDCVTKSSSTSLNFFLEETNTFDNSLPESETFCFNLEKKSSGNPTSYLDLSLPDYEAFFHDSEPDSGDFTMDVVEVIFDNPTREPRVHVPNVLATHPTLHLDLNFILSSDSLFAYVVWIFFPFLTYPITLLYLLSCGNEDTIFDLGISVYHSFMPSVCNQSGTFMKFNVYPNNLNESPMEILSSTCSPMDQ